MPNSPGTSPNHSPKPTASNADKSQDYFIESKTILKGLQNKSLAEHEQPVKQ